MARARTRTRRAAVDPNQAVELIKALTPLIGQRQMQLPGNSTAAPQTRTLDQVTAVLHAEQMMRNRQSLTTAPMPRDPRDEVPFGPIEPSVPDPLDPGNTSTGRPSPRLSEYPVAWNIPGNGERPLPWSVLRAASKNVDIMRRCIEIRKQRIRGMEWSWDVSPTAIEQAFRAQDQATMGHDDIAADLRDKYSAAIGQLTEFWKYPWRSNGLDFSTWAATTVDEALVLDAVAIYPRLSLGGQLLGLEIIDGTTIKPLLDFRGARPVPPFPAFQQILYGFPRGEFTATAEVDDDGNQIVNNAFLADQLIYHRENYQVNTPYGYGPTEQALIAARLYLRRQGWMLSEYDDGVMPEMMLSSDAGAMTLLPEQRRAYEQDLNDDLSGQTAARHRAKLLYSGLKPEYPPSVDERYKPEYDLFLIKLLSSFYGVPATELGFSETKGLGGSGMHQAQQDNRSETASKPDMAMIATIVNETARRFQNVPPELMFTFNETQGADAEKDSTMMVAQLGAGVITLNEARSQVGKAAFPIPEADTPYVMGQTGPIFIEGSKAAADASVAASLAATQAKANVATDDQSATGTGTDDAPQDESDDDGGQDQVKAASPDHDVANAVLEQLRPDYPEHALSWVPGAHWRGPVAVPLSKVDMDDKADWDASSGQDDAEKVQRFAGYIKRGRLKPVVMVQTPGDDRYKIVDGHHRTLAAESINRPVMAYVGKVGAKVGPWTQMHASQHPADGDTHDALEPVSAPPMAKSVDLDAEWIDDQRRRERAAYHRFIAKGTRARPFEWEHHTADEVDLIKGGQFEEDKHPRAADGKFGSGGAHQMAHGGRATRGAHATTFHAGSNASQADAPQGESAAQFNADNRSATSRANHAAHLREQAERTLASASARAGHDKLVAAQHAAHVALTKARTAAEAYAHAHHLTGDERKAYIAHATARQQRAYDKAKAAHDKATAASSAASKKKRDAATAAAKQTLGKAGDADPKVPAGQPAPPPPDHRWPGWMLDSALASLTAAQLSQALIGGLDIPALAAAAVAAWPAGHEPPTVGAVTAWLTARGITADGLTAMLSPVVRSAQTEAYAMGVRSATAILEAPDPRQVGSVTVDWDGWKPGNVDAARRIISQDGRSVEPLFAQTAQVIQGIGATRLDELAAVLADGLEQGESTDAIAHALRAMGTGPWSELVAWTETNRATSQAAVDVYAANGVDRKEWFTALDQRVCPICAANEAEGPVDIDQPFASGDQNPPGHPRCRCAVLPVVSVEKSARAVATGNEGNAERLHAYWTAGEGLAKWVDTPHPWTALFHHLSKYLPPDEAKRTTTVWFHEVTGTYPNSGHHNKEK